MENIIYQSERMQWATVKYVGRTKKKYWSKRYFAIFSSCFYRFDFNVRFCFRLAVSRLVNGIEEITLDEKSCASVVVRA